MEVVMRSIRTTSLVAIGTAMVAVAGLLIGANSASADMVWTQSYQRSSQTEACTAQPGETPWQASWGTDSSWHPSWEQWANGGRGGWTCTRAITWARSGDPYPLGSIGPGGGLVFLISNGVHYEVAPRTWRFLAGDPGIDWCREYPSTVTGAGGTAIGTGSANSAAMAATCSAGAANLAAAYAGTNGSAGQWYIPSKDELNALCNYSRNPSAPAAPSVACSGSQDAGFAAGAYGLENGQQYWSSSLNNATQAWVQVFTAGAATSSEATSYSLKARPIRAF
jgi:hypothetical protein